MTSKELNAIQNRTRRTENVPLTPKQVEEIVNKLEVLEILKPYLNQSLHIKETDGFLVISFKPITFYDAKVMDLDFCFNDTQQIENIRKVKEWLDENNTL